MGGKCLTWVGTPPCSNTNHCLLSKRGSVSLLKKQQLTNLNGLVTWINPRPVQCHFSAFKKSLVFCFGEVEFSLFWALFSVVTVLLKRINVPTALMKSGFIFDNNQMSASFCLLPTLVNRWYLSSF